tara:strand:- start:3505 stop:4203 length:699 start_codon:yes stop_codon:yes gene_type:complete
MTQLLLIDDDIELCKLLQEYLITEGFTVDMAHDGEQGYMASQSKIYDAIILDVMLPIFNGVEVLRKLRDTLSTKLIPVLMLTAKGDTIDRIIGLEIGADDYLAKPCNPRELVARLRAILRRSHSPNVQFTDSDMVTVDNLILQKNNHRVSYDNSNVALTGAEFTVLELLMRNKGQVISKELLTERALGRKLTPYDRSIDVHVSNIRKKLAASGASKELIINIRGSGYMLTCL